MLQRLLTSVAFLVAALAFLAVPPPALSAADCDGAGGVICSELCRRFLIWESCKPTSYYTGGF